MSISPPPAAFVRRHRLGVFFVLAYVFSWAYWVPMAISGVIVVPGTGSPSHAPGLLGPALAALIVTAVADGRAGLRDLAHRMVRWRVGWRWYAAVAAPIVAFAAVASVIAVTGGQWPRPAELAEYSGLPAFGLPAVFVLALVVNGFGEETGWRGLALPQLQRRHGPLTASLLLSLGWAGWHLPLFWIIDSYRHFNVIVLPGFLIGLACGAIVLTWVYNGTGGSILMVALWHTCYNMTTATTAATGPLAAIVSALVIAWAAVLVAGDIVARRRGGPSPLQSRDRQTVKQARDAGGRTPGTKDPDGLGTIFSAPGDRVGRGSGYDLDRAS
jgi:membrane protease YdiL (CAAX protease family)